MNTSMIVYRLFDVADEIDLDLVQALWTSPQQNRFQAPPGPYIYQVYYF